jgi:hypothetical protein
MFERGCAHPILGSILLIVLVLLLAMAFLHSAHEGMDAVSDVGAICFGIATFLGLAAVERLRRDQPQLWAAVPGDRGPPTLPETFLGQPAQSATTPLSIPLRR